VNKFIANCSRRTNVAPSIVVLGWANKKGGVEVSPIPMDNLIGGDP